MPPNNPHPRPELKIHADRIVFVYPRPEEEPADKVHSDTVGTIFGAFLFLLIAGVLGAVAGFAADIDAQTRLTVAIVGASFVGLSVLVGLVAFFRHRWHDQLIQRAVDCLPTDLRVEDRRLIERFASGREVVWPRETVEDIVVETRTETVGSEGDATIDRCYLCVILRAGGKVDLYGPAARDSLQAQDLFWMAGELRGALQVPYDAPPTPLEGASLEKTADGITIHLPSDDPEKQWRTNVKEFLMLGGVISAILFIVWAAVHSRDTFTAEVGSKAWKDSVFMLIAIPVLAAIFGGLALAEYLNKKQSMLDIADKILVALGVRSGTLFCRYASGREVSWGVTEIAAVSVDRVEQRDKVRLHLKNGLPMHLFGELLVEEKNKLQREGLVWLALELARALGLVVPAPVENTPSVSEAIIDFAARPQKDDRIQSIS